MADELVDIVDENNQPTGEQKMKSEAHQFGFWHRVIHVWLYDKNQGVLLQLRAKTKKLFPDVWDVVVGGHVSAGEDLIISAVREAKEELNLNIDPQKLSLFKIFTAKIRFNDVVNNEFIYIYTLPFDGKISDLKLQDEEVQDVKFFTLTDLQNQLTSNPNKFIDHYVNENYWVEIFAYLQDKFGLK